MINATDIPKVQSFLAQMDSDMKGFKEMEESEEALLLSLKRYCESWNLNYNKIKIVYEGSMVAE